MKNGRFLMALSLIVCASVTTSEGDAMQQKGGKERRAVPFTFHRLQPAAALAKPEKIFEKICSAYGNSEKCKSLCLEFERAVRALPPGKKIFVKFSTVEGVGMSVSRNGCKFGDTFRGLISEGKVSVTFSRTDLFYLLEDLTHKAIVDGRYGRIIEKFTFGKIFSDCTNHRHDVFILEGLSDSVKLVLLSTMHPAKRVEFICCPSEESVPQLVIVPGIDDRFPWSDSISLLVCGLFGYYVPIPYSSTRHYEKGIDRTLCIFYLLSEHLKNMLSARGVSVSLSTLNDFALGVSLAKIPSGTNFDCGFVSPFVEANRINPELVKFSPWDQRKFFELVENSNSEEFRYRFVLNNILSCNKWPVYAVPSVKGGLTVLVPKGYNDLGKIRRVYSASGVSEELEINLIECSVDQSLNDGPTKCFVDE
ncbi:MAG: hypothetical protein LBB21_01400 [Holosporaceae bacterium]|jgi:hypothetical protein|nr:hypothetical protein [Holosporaceae bacterium]